MQQDGPAEPKLPGAWNRAARRRGQLTRLRSDAMAALEKRFVKPDDQALEDLLDSLIRDVHAAQQAWVAAVEEAR